MERIRKALDLAREERAQRAEGLRVDAAQEPAAVTVERRGLPVPLIYSRTQVFEPRPELLERSRIALPGTLGTAAAAYRLLRTQVLQRMGANGWRTLAIVSPGEADGKTTTAINLAASLAGDRQHTVLLVDYDLKRPGMAAAFGLQVAQGVDDVLLSRARLEDCLYHPAPFERLVLLPARAPVAGSSEVLASPRSRELVAELKSRYLERLVIFDLPPVLGSDDALAFTPLVDCALLVVAEGRTRREDLLRTTELLRQIPIVGMVLNRASDVPAAYG